jgi:hypothetical protein
MIPRSYLDEDSRFLDSFIYAHRESLRNIFGQPSFCSNTHYVCALKFERPDKQGWVLVGQHEFQVNGPICAIAIIEALTVDTKPGDLADAFAWFEHRIVTGSSESSQQVYQAYVQSFLPSYVQSIRQRITLVHDTPMMEISVPDLTRTFNNEITYNYDVVRPGYCVRHSSYWTPLRRTP